MVRMGLSMVPGRPARPLGVGEADSGRGCVDSVDVVLLYLRMPGSFDGVVAAGMISDRTRVLELAAGCTEYARWSLRHQREGVDVAETYDGEVAAIDGRDLTDVQSLGRGHDGCVDGAERQVAVPGDQFSDAQPIGGNHGLDAERAVCEVAEEANFGFRTETSTEQVGHLG